MVELFTINLSNSIYNKKAISEGRNVFAPYAEIKFTPQSSNGVQISIRTKAEFEQDRRQICCEFLNYILDRSIQLFIEQN